MKCARCGEPCDRDSVDVGVGVIHGPWGCSVCGWSSDSDYDLSGDDRDPLDAKGGAVDQWGGYHPAGSVRARALRLERWLRPQYTDHIAVYYWHMYRRTRDATWYHLNRREYSRVMD